jgi:hypothetical protein
MNSRRVTFLVSGKLKDSHDREGVGREISALRMEMRPLFWFFVVVSVPEEIEVTLCIRKNMAEGWAGGWWWCKVDGRMADSAAGLSTINPLWWK